MIDDAADDAVDEPSDAMCRLFEVRELINIVLLFFLIRNGGRILCV